MGNCGPSINNLFYEVLAWPLVCAKQQVNAYILQIPNLVLVFKLLKGRKNFGT
jgi:hypothetical protein